METTTVTTTNVVYYKDPYFYSVVCRRLAQGEGLVYQCGESADNNRIEDLSYYGKSGELRERFTQLGSSYSVSSDITSVDWDNIISTCTAFKNNTAYAYISIVFPYNSDSQYSYNDCKTVIAYINSYALNI